MSRRGSRKRIRRRERLARADGRHAAMTLETRHQKTKKTSCVLAILDEIHGAPGKPLPPIVEVEGLVSDELRIAGED